ncbi:MAG: PH domain-containing protein [Rubrivivax sp.]|nr:PH domain-containing protein [Rubrivivax sp.]
MTAGRREHEYEPEPGLPEALPAGERVLWQGAPAAAWMARKVFHLPVVVAYFALLLGWQAATAWHDGGTLLAVRQALAGSLLLVSLALGLLGLIAWLSARTTLYTLTDKRIVMRVGIVLTVTYNLPLRCIDAANVHRLGAHHGDLALVLRGDTRIAYAHLWPHVRPWRLQRTQPMLRCLPDVDGVAAKVAAAWSAANHEAATAAPESASPSPALPGRSAHLRHAPRAAGAAAGH